MVGFLTLFLGLVTGIQPVQVAVGPEVARVEIHLDGRVVGTLDAEPWTVPVDLGPELSPHFLKAVAFDAQGREVGRAAQTLNLPRPPVELGLSVDTSVQPAVARLLWRSVLDVQPTDVQLVFDGEPVLVADPSRVELPPHDPEELHFLRAELTFEDGSRATDELVFGAASDQVRQELTAVPVRIPEKTNPTPETLRGLFRAEGRDRVPVAVDGGTADVVVVPDPGARDGLRRIGAVLRRGGSVPRPGTDRAFRSPLFRLAMPSRGVDVRLLWPQPRRRAGSALDFDVFPMGPERTRDEGGIYWQVAELPNEWADTGNLRLADAVAVAASRAAARNRPRAVVVLLSESPTDAGTLRADQVERYLARLAVPLHVWSLHPEDDDREPKTGGFSDARVIDSVRSLTRAAKALQDDLDTQRIVWIEGRFLPRQIHLAPSDVVERAVPLPRAPQTSGRDRVASFLTSVGRTETPKPAASIPRDLRWERARRLLGAEADAEERLGPWRLLTDVDDAELRRFLDDVAERLETQYASRFGPAPREPEDGEQSVILFAEESDYRTYEELGDRAVGLDLEGHAGGGLAVLYREDRRDAELASLLVHELSHLLHERTFGDRLPPWLEEGMAEDLALSEIDPDGSIRPGTLGGDARIDPYASLGGERLEITGGIALIGRLAQSVGEGRLPSLEGLLAMSREEFVQPAGRGMRYATSAFFVRFLLDRHGEGFRAFLADAAQGRPVSPGSLAERVGVEVGGLERRFHAWVRAEALRAGYR